MSGISDHGATTGSVKEEFVSAWLSQGGAVEPETLSLTGDAVVDDALAEFDTLAGRPLRDHVAVIDAVQRALAGRLAEADG